MKRAFRKNLKLQRKFCENEFNIICTQFLNLSTPCKLTGNFESNLQNLNYFHAFLARTSRAKIHRFCRITGRSRGIVRFFRVSRLTLRKLAQRRVLVGLRTGAR